MIDKKLEIYGVEFEKCDSGYFWGRKDLTEWSDDWEIALLYEGRGEWSIEYDIVCGPVRVKQMTTRRFPSLEKAVEQLKGDLRPIHRKRQRV